MKTIPSTGKDAGRSEVGSATRVNLGSHGAWESSLPSSSSLIPNPGATALSHQTWQHSDDHDPTRSYCIKDSSSQLNKWQGDQQHHHMGPNAVAWHDSDSDGRLQQQWRQKSSRRHFPSTTSLLCFWCLANHCPHWLVLVLVLAIGTAALLNVNDLPLSLTDFDH